MKRLQHSTRASAVLRTSSTAGGVSSRSLLPSARSLTTTSTRLTSRALPLRVAGTRALHASAGLRAAAASANAAGAPDMFCFQCEQTRDNKGCMTVGVCGKTPEVASLQDLLIHATKGVSIYAKGARELGTCVPYRNWRS